MNPSNPAAPTTHVDPLPLPIIRLFQALCWLVFQIGLLIYVRKRSVRLSRKDINGSPLVFAANHQSQLDHFLILACLPFGMFWQLTPMRFFAHNGLFKSPLTKLGIMLGGSFPTRAYKNYLFGLEGARQLMGRGQHLFIFPEGKRSPYDTVPAKSGVAELARLPKVKIIPVQIKWTRRRWWRSCTIIIGEPFSAAKDSAQDIMDHIYALR
jgi:1-acyl-sn-glycerol-3-phosphate acyltransferase